MRLRIIIDDLDRKWAPQQPYTLNVYDGEDTNPLTVESIVGGDIPEMLGELAEKWPEVMETLADV